MSEWKWQLIYHPHSRYIDNKNICEIEYNCILILKGKSLMKIVGYDMTQLAASKLFAKSNYKPQDVDVVELHDCFSANELITYEALGLCEPGKAGEFIDRGDNTYGGKYVINPSGGLISKGHPLGATGLAQCSELCWQLRGEADRRQVPNAKLALQHNLGLGGAVVVSLYRLGFPNARNPIKLNLTNAKQAIVSDPEGFMVTPLLQFLDAAMQDDQENLIEKVRAVYGLRVNNGPDGKTAYWVINCKTGKGKIIYNGKGKLIVYLRKIISFVIHFVLQFQIKLMLHLLLMIMMLLN